MNNSLIDKIKDKLILGAGIAAVATISYNELKDSPETYVGFNEIKKKRNGKSIPRQRMG